ncbi:hypothetical protein K1T71_011215 [Dendrolimus kikuchii]|uniref:Uncharacterized protein n=1 Tax=Dendrolimus kikuchii TaxID=765133 RepID=A0ACC1CN75_9NEOP|nr:hypothetical protein K1T71_011215 [Dendrolimus kikuchii]
MPEKYSRYLLEQAKQRVGCLVIFYSTRKKTGTNYPSNTDTQTIESVKATRYLHCQ